MSHEKIQRHAGNPRDDTDAQKEGKHVTIKAENALAGLGAPRTDGSNQKLAEREHGSVDTLILLP